MCVHFYIFNGVSTEYRHHKSFKKQSFYRNNVPQNSTVPGDALFSDVSPGIVPLVHASTIVLAVPFDVEVLRVTCVP